MRPDTGLESFEQTELRGAASWKGRHRKIKGRRDWHTDANN